MLSAPLKGTRPQDREQTLSPFVGKLTSLTPRGGSVTSPEATELETYFQNYKLRYVSKA